MSHFSYADAGLPIPDRIGAAHRQAWERLALPGNGWSGAERVAMAAASRGATVCALCCERKQALSPGAVEGRHDHDGVLPEAVVEAVHRVVADPTRLSRTWYEKLLAEGLSDAQYVELVGLVVAVFSIDELHRALGLPCEPLPEPIAGAPDPYRPANVTLDVAWVPMIPAGKLADAESDLWPANRTGNVMRALSLVPAAVRQLKDLSEVHYLSAAEMTDFGVRRAIDRAQMELIAGRVSALNECFY